MMQLWNWLKSLFAKKVVSIEQPQAPQPEPKTPPPPAPETTGGAEKKPTLEQLRSAYVKRMAGFVGTHEVPRGSNRGPDIDKANQYVGNPLGSPYCIAGALYTLNLVCLELGLKNPVIRTGGTQNFYNLSSIRLKQRGPHELALAGDIGILQDRRDHAHGHAVVVREDMKAFPSYLTIEWNTNSAGDPNGDGVYMHTRSTDGDGLKSFRGFVDVCKWVMDAN